MKQLRIALIGYGKMGKAIEEVALKRGHVISHRIDQENSAEMLDITPFNTDIAIEFTAPHVAPSNLKTLIGNHVNVVCGTTGWLHEFQEIKNAVEAEDTGFIFSPNFSIGVNLFFELNRRLASLMADREEYACTMEEWHHIHKQDKPSGTALALAGDILRELTQYEGWSLEPEEGKIPIECVRKGEVTGIHTVEYTSEIDKISIRHEAFTRSGFALGAVVAAEFLYQKKGIFNMKDVLSF